MKMLKIFLLGLIATTLLVGCGEKKNDSSNLSSDINSGISKVESGVSSGLSDLESKMDFDTSKNSTPESSEGAPISGASSDIPAEIHITPDTIDLNSLDNKKQGWGQGVQLDEKNRPISSIKFQEKYGKYDAFFIKNDVKTIYLTFDQGYENGYTASILDTLKEKNIKALFFVTMDYAKKQPELVKRMIAEGHLVGNHSDNHVSYPTVTIETCESETMNLHNYISENFGYNMTLFRPPMGEFSDRVLAQLQQLGYKTVFWSYAYKDWEVNNQMEPQKALEKLNNALHDGAIYLLHTVGSTNNQILGDFIDYALSQGYQFKTLS